MTKIFPHCTISVGLAPLADYLYVQWVSMVFLYLNIYDLSGGGIRTRPRHVGRWRPRYVGRWRPNAAAPCRAVAAERGRVMSGGGGGRMRPRYVGHWRPNAAASCRAVAAAPCRVALMGHGRNLKFAQLVTEFVGLAYPAARGNKL